MTRKKAEEEIKKITTQLIKKYRPKKVILFGSAADPAVSEPNDLDFFIVKDEVPYYGIDRMREVRRLINNEEAVDFFVFTEEEAKEQTKKRNPFLRDIFETGVVLYAG